MLWLNPHHPQINIITITQEENQQIERESSAAIFFDNPARGMVPLPAPPPTPTSLNVFGGESDRGDENGMDTDMAADREDDVGDAAMQREMFGEYHGEALNTTRKGMATTDAMASSRAGGSNARAIGLGAPLTYTSSAPPPYRDTTAGAAAAYDARVLFAQVLSSMPPPPPPHHGTTARETDGSGVGTAGGGGIRGLPGRLMVRTASAPESRGPDNHTVNSPTAGMCIALLLLLHGCVVSLFVDWTCVLAYVLIHAHSSSSTNTPPHQHPTSPTQKWQQHHVHVVSNACDSKSCIGTRTKRYDMSSAR